MITALLKKDRKITATDMMGMQKDIKDSYLEQDLFLWTGLVKRIVKHMDPSLWLDSAK